MRNRQLSSTRSSLLAGRAHAMRQSPSEPEARLFRELSGARLGVAFKRQVVLCGRFIADLVAPAARLVVEIDGAHHERRRRADARRDRVLERAGYRVLRLPADLVLGNLSEAVERVRCALEPP